MSYDESHEKRSFVVQKQRKQIRQKMMFISINKTPKNFVSGQTKNQKNKKHRRQYDNQQIEQLSTNVK